jgi:ATP-dependent Clp protease ATP-binding subunit ClpC
MFDQSFIDRLRLTPRGEQIISIARRQAEKRSQSEIRPELVLLGVALLEQGVAYGIFEKKLSIADLRKNLEKALIPGAASQTSRPLAEDTKKALLVARREANKLMHSYVGTEHIILGVLAGKNGACKILKKMGIELKQMRKHILEGLSPLGI